MKNFIYETNRFENIFVLHANIRGLKTNFENFRNLLNNTGSSLNIICLTGTWCSKSEIINNACTQTAIRLIQGNTKFYSCIYTAILSFTGKYKILQVCSNGHSFFFTAKCKNVVNCTPQTAICISHKYIRNLTIYRQFSLVS